MTVTNENKELKAGWKNELVVQTYKKSDVAKHNSKHDLWIIIYGKGSPVQIILRAQSY